MSFGHGDGESWSNKHEMSGEEVDSQAAATNPCERCTNSMVYIQGLSPLRYHEAALPATAAALVLRRSCRLVGQISPSADA